MAQVRPRPILTVAAALFTLADDGLNVVLQARDREPFKGRLALMGAGFAACAAGAAALALRGMVLPAHALEAMAVAAAVAAILVGAARAVSRIATALEPTPAQVSAATARYHRRQESEKARDRGTLFVAHQG